MKYNKRIREILKKFYEVNKEPHETDLLILAKKCNLTPLEVNEWFQQKRTRSQIRKAKRLRRKNEAALEFYNGVKRCKTCANKLNRWLATANRFLNCDSSDSFSDSSWEHTRSEDEEDDDDAEALQLATEAAEITLLQTQAELANIVQENIMKKHDLVGDGPSTSARTLQVNQLAGEEVISILYDDMPSTSKAALTVSKSLCGANQFDIKPSTSKDAAVALVDNNQIGSFEERVDPEVLSYLDNIPSTSRAAASTRALYGVLIEASINEHNQYLENLTSTSMENVEETEIPYDLDEAPVYDDEPSTLNTGAARLVYSGQKIRKTQTTELTLKWTESQNISQEKHSISDGDTPNTSGETEPKDLFTKQGFKMKVEMNMELEMEDQESDGQLSETPTVPMIEDDDETRWNSNDSFAMSIISTGRPIGPEDEISMSSAAAAVEELVEVSYLYNQQFLVPITLSDFDMDNEESTSDPNVLFYIGFNNINREE